MKKEKRMIPTENNDFNYFVYTPNNVIDNMPVLLFLHGIGERGDKIENIEKYAIPKYMNSIDIPFIVIAPQCHDNNFWDYHLREVEKIIDIESKNFNFDRRNIFICGYSMGAYGAWNFLMQRPKLFKGIISVSGGTMLKLDYDLNKLKDKPILIYHGDSDNVVDVSESTLVYDKLIKCGAKDVTLKILPGIDHHITDIVFGDNHIYDWLEEKSGIKFKEVS